MSKERIPMPDGETLPVLSSEHALKGLEERCRRLEVALESLIEQYGGCLECGQLHGKPHYGGCSIGEALAK